MRTVQKPSSVVLASLKPSTHTRHTRRAFTRCGLAGRAFLPFSFLSIIVWTAIFLVGLAVATAAQHDETQSMSSALAYRAEGLILARCSVCHSPDLIYQQRLAKDRWEATVEKMMRWGAEMSNEEATLLVQYLAARYHPGAPEHLSRMRRE